MGKSFFLFFFKSKPFFTYLPNFVIQTFHTQILILAVMWAVYVEGLYHAAMMIPAQNG